MKKLFLFISILYTLTSTAQPVQTGSWFIWNNGLYLKNGPDSTYYGTHELAPVMQNIMSVFAAKQNQLVSGTNIKTINGQTVLGSGDLPISGSASWGSVTGTLSNQTDLQTALNGKLSTTIPAGTIGVPFYATINGSNATTTGQSLVDITGLTLSLVANAKYEIEAVLIVSTTAVTTGTGYGIQYSAAGATIEGFVQGSSTTTADKTLRLNAFNTSSQAWLTTSGQTGGILIKATVTVGANAGALSARHLKVTSGTSTVFIGSYLKATRIL